MTVFPQLEILGSADGKVEYKESFHRTGAIYEITVRAGVNKEIMQEAAAEIRFSHPAWNICGMWRPDCGKDRSLPPDWASDRKSTACISAPVFCLYDEEGKNCLTAALSEAAKEVHYGAGIREEDGLLYCFFSVKLEKEELPWRARLYINSVGQPYERALEQVADWWEKDCGMKPLRVPEQTRLPMYSTWYSYHQKFRENELEKEAALARKAGFETLIVDDGWQTADSERGYAFCGDWQVCTEKISDMRAHVKRIHELGMKYMLWFSVPFIGNRSKAWERFSDRLLWFDPKKQAGIADIRYPEVRKYLLDLYKRAVGEWDIDGVKLDFLDNFYIRGDYPAGRKAGMDFQRVEDALLIFLGADQRGAFKGKAGCDDRIQTVVCGSSKE